MLDRAPHHLNFALHIFYLSVFRVLCTMKTLCPWVITKILIEAAKRDRCSIFAFCGTWKLEAAKRDRWKRNIWGLFLFCQFNLTFVKARHTTIYLSLPSCNENKQNAPPVILIKHCTWMIKIRPRVVQTSYIVPAKVPVHYVGTPPCPIREGYQVQ